MNTQKIRNRVRNRLLESKTINPSIWYTDDEFLELIKDSFVLVDDEDFLGAVDSNGHEVSDDWYIDTMNEWLDNYTNSSIRVVDVKHGHRTSDDMFEWKLSNSGAVLETKKAKPTDSFSKLKEWIESYDVENIFEAYENYNPKDDARITQHSDIVIKKRSKSAAQDLRYFEKLASRITKKPTMVKDLYTDADFVFQNTYHLLDEKISKNDLIDRLINIGFRRWNKETQAFRKTYHDGGYEEIVLMVTMNANEEETVTEIHVSGYTDRG